MMDRSNSFRTRQSSKDVLRSMLSNRPHLNLSNEIHFGEPVLKAHGGFCDVFQGRWMSQGVCIYKVAIKRLRVHIQTDRDFAKQLAKEIRVWSGLYHHNVLPLLGYVIEGEYPSLVAEWMENGTVSRYMRDHPGTDLLQMILGIARGLEYIHGQGVIHSDIKADNVLVSRHGEPVICDFGISRIISASQSFGETSGHKVKGTVRWMARELLADSQSVHSKESDIWAFGMTIYELLTNQVPFHEIKLDVQVMFTILQGYTPPRPVGFSDWPIYWQKLWSICFVSWNRYPQLRKPMSEIVWYLELLCRHAEEERKGQIIKDSSRTPGTPRNPVYCQPSALGQGEYDLVAEDLDDLCPSSSGRAINFSHLNGNTLHQGHSENSPHITTNRFSPPPFRNEELRAQNMQKSRTESNRSRAPSLGNKNIIRDFDLRQSSSASKQKTLSPQTGEHLDIIKKWRETLKLNPATVDSETYPDTKMEHLSPPKDYEPAHALSRRSLSSSTGSSTIVASIENQSTITEIGNPGTQGNGGLIPFPRAEPSESILASSDTSGFSNPRTLRRRTGTVSRIKF